jgi:hypothetical protein
MRDVLVLYGFGQRSIGSDLPIRLLRNVQAYESWNQIPKGKRFDSDIFQTSTAFQSLLVGSCAL